jgi:hypothetical protein
MFDDQEKHCFFAVFNLNGQCIAPCHKNALIGPGETVDCTGKASETIEDFLRRVNSENKLH